VGMRLRTGRARWGMAALATVALGVAVTVTLPAAAGPAGQDTAPTADGPRAEG
jgi:hypothetical protein